MGPLAEGWRQKNVKLRQATRGFQDLPAPTRTYRPPTEAPTAAVFRKAVFRCVCEPELRQAREENHVEGCGRMREDAEGEPPTTSFVAARRDWRVVEKNVFSPAITCPSLT